MVKEVVRNGCLFCYMLLRIKMLYNTLLYAQTYRCLYLPTQNALKRINDCYYTQNRAYCVK